jgi:hypothetical protein
MRSKGVLPTEERSDAVTHVDVLREKVVRGLVFLDEVAVDAGAGKSRADEEAKEAATEGAHRLARGEHHSRGSGRRGEDTRRGVDSSAEHGSAGDGAEEGWRAHRDGGFERKVVVFGRVK